MDQPTAKPPRNEAPKTGPTAVPTARIRLTSKEPPPLDPSDESGSPSERPSRPLHIITEEVTYNRRADARVDDDE